MYSNSNLTDWEAGPEDTGNRTINPLGIFMCYFADFPDSQIDCSKRQPNFCLKCEMKVKFFTGESISDNSLGHLLSRIVWVLSILVGSVGTVVNALTIVVLSRMKSSKAFYFLLRSLACVDFLCSLSGINASTAVIAYFGIVSTVFLNSMFKVWRMVIK